MNSKLFQQIRILDPVSNTDRIADVLIIDSKIAAVETQISEFPTKTEIQNSHGLILGPGLVDLYSHSGEPGFEERETIESLIQAATAGGFTRLAILPDTFPPVDNPAGLARLQNLAKNYASTPIIYYWGAITQGLQGEQMTELGELATTGVVGFADGLPLQNLGLLRRILEYLKPLNKPLALCCNNSRLAGKGVMREGYDSIRLGLPGVPTMAETSALAAVLELVDAIGTPVHIMRVSTARSVELIRVAKNRGLPITASTTWMHLLLDTQAMEGKSPFETKFFPYDTNLRLEPPLGNSSDRLALVQGIKDGVLDAIAIEHAPFCYEEKTVTFYEAPPGTIGLEIALPLLWQNFVQTGKLSALDLWRVLSTAPSKCLGLSPGEVRPQKSAEVTLFGPQETWVVEKQTLKSRSINTPWLGKQIQGRVLEV
ncbi:MAG: dihydroorotase [Okeania sp. SIO2G4]|uniref:dihydroorotase n=1 Tax=unclassified Okeania TaxID=2634635 RepID=UPI0013BBD5F5|nr:MULTISPECIES: dihydroorotase [unclassified Okeania]NEP38385.1 dihydroorotase [Okeania sp. SIO2H7]NEP70843.1 dihydroorotase [Okeania sp. SIO2G5]NEP92378.1 dihydroorotase [Okeania sp. SIO2F5]NEQ89894.1 dihydroorotase [Okeania sp. SIO2G4]